MEFYCKYIVLFCLFPMFSCVSDKGRESGKKSLQYVIDVENCLQEKRTFYLSEIADTLEYMELKMPKGEFVNAVQQIYPVEDFLIVRGREGVFKFTREGNFIKQIGTQGQGPKEYNGLLYMDVDYRNKELILVDYNKYLFFDYDGNFLCSENWKARPYIALSDSIYWVSTLPTAADKYIAYGFNAKDDTVAFIPNKIYNIKGVDEGSRTGFAIPLAQKEFYRYRDNLFFKGSMGNDTVYYLSGVKCMPYAAFDMGKLRIPDEYAPWYSWEKYEIYGKDYFGVVAISENDNYFFLTLLRWHSVEKIPYVHNEDNYRYVIYDKKAKKGFCVDKITDDITGGPKFWPEHIIGDYFVTTISHANLMDAVEEENCSLSPSAEKQFSNWGYETNELVTYCKDKSGN